MAQPMAQGNTSRLEPLFISSEIDFMMSIGMNKTYTEFVSDSFWVPRYRSDQENKYEKPDKGNFRCVELVHLDEERKICFEEASGIPPDASDNTVQRAVLNHGETIMSCNENLQQFLNTLTGWDLLVVFSAKDIQQRKKWGRRHPRPGPADVFCFRKDQQTRIAIRRKDVEDGRTIDWTTAALVTADVDTKKQELDFEFPSTQNGRKLSLATITAAEDETNESEGKTETWIITVVSHSDEIHSKLRVSNILERSVELRLWHRSFTEFH